MTIMTPPDDRTDHAFALAEAIRGAGDDRRSSFEGRTEMVAHEVTSREERMEYIISLNGRTIEVGTGTLSDGAVALQSQIVAMTSSPTDRTPIEDVSTVGCRKITRTLAYHIGSLGPATLAFVVDFSRKSIVT